MKSRVLIFLLLLLILPLAPALAQKKQKSQKKVYWYKEIEAFVGGGTTNYFGDVGGRDSKITGAQAFIDHLDLDLRQTRVQLAGGLRATPRNNLAISAQAAGVFLSGNDAWSDYAWRGYSFETSIFEFSAQLEYYLAQRTTGFAPYVYIGPAGMVYRYTNSQNDTPKWNTTNALLLGLGARLPETKQFTQSIDFGFHFTTTDYLDGYKTFRNSKDLFFLVSYKLNFSVFTLWHYDYKGHIK